MPKKFDAETYAYQHPLQVIKEAHGLQLGETSLTMQEALLVLLTAELRDIAIALMDLRPIPDGPDSRD